MLDNREELFWAKVDIKSEDECWEWTVAKNNTGYGIFWNGHKLVLAHRFAYKAFHSCKIPSKKVILHSCDNPSCCNPSHLCCGTQADNLYDRFAKGRYDSAKQAKNHAKLYDEEIWLIKRLWNSGKVSQAKIAKMFKVAKSTISLHVRGISTRSRGSCHD